MRRWTRDECEVKGEIRSKKSGAGAGMREGGW